MGTQRVATLSPQLSATGFSSTAGGGETKEGLSLLWLRLRAIPFFSPVRDVHALAKTGKAPTSKQEGLRTQQGMSHLLRDRFEAYKADKIFPDHQGQLDASTPL